MKKLLLIESSPRKQNSLTTDMALRLIERLQSVDTWEVDRLDLWNTDLPDMNGVTMDAKYAVFSGTPMTEEQADHWQRLNRFVTQFAQADMVVLCAPMWNWGIPYRLKHYVDVITQPQLTFNWTPEDGYIPVLPPRDVVVVTSSGGDYTPGSGLEHEDFAYRYLQQWLQYCMGCNVEFVHLTMTATGPEGVANAMKNAEFKIETMIEQYALTA